MDVDATELRNVEQRLGKNLSESDHNVEISVERAKLCEEVGIGRLDGLENGYVTKTLLSNNLDFGRDDL